MDFCINIFIFKYDFTFVINCLPSDSEKFVVELLCPNVYHYIISMNLIKAFEGHQLAKIVQTAIKLTKKSISYLH